MFFRQRIHPDGRTLALNREAFIGFLTQTAPPRPANMDVIIRSNLGLVSLA